MRDINLYCENLRWTLIMTLLSWALRRSTYIYIYIIYGSLSLELLRCEHGCSLCGFMSIGFWVSEVLRESRYLFSPSSCPSFPWGAICLVILCTFLLGCFVGAVATLLITSSACRSSCLVVLRVLVNSLQSPPARERVWTANQRLAEYRS